MSRKTSEYNQIIHILQELHKLYPEWNMGRHLATALDGYGDVWGLTDREFIFLLSKYKTRMELDIPHVEDSEELDKIVKGGMDLDSLFKEEDDYGDSY
jgi:hypothetical protein